jgi:hypothetical protein
MRISSSFLLLSLAITNAQQPRTLDGDVVDSVTGGPLALTRVKLVSGKSTALYAAADAGGHFHFDNLAATPYTLSVDHPGYLATSPIRIGAAQTSVRIPLTAGAVLYGSVTDPNGLPAATDGVFYIQIFEERQDKSGSERVVAGRPYIFVDDRGQYRSALLAPGTYYVAALCQQAPTFRSRTWRATYYPHALDAVSAKAIQLSPGQKLRADIQVISQSGIRVSGKVLVSPYDAPPPGVQVTTWVNLVAHGELIGRPGYSSGIKDDQFEVADLLPGKYTLVAQTRQMRPNGDDQKYLSGALREVEIGDRDITGLVIELQPLAEVTGKVAFAEGCPAAPVPVHLRGGGIMGVREYSAVSGPDGSFAFGTFPPSSLFISAGGSGTATVFLGDRDITKTGFDYPPPTPQPLRVVINCATGGAR